MTRWARPKTARTPQRIVAAAGLAAAVCALAACSSGGAKPAADGSTVASAASGSSTAAAQAWYTNKVQSYLGGVSTNLAGFSVSSVEQAAGLTGKGANCAIPQQAAAWFTANPPPAGVAGLAQSWTALTGVLTDAAQACTSGNTAQLASDVTTFLSDLQTLAQTLQQDGLLPK